MGMPVNSLCRVDDYGEKPVAFVATKMQSEFQRNKKDPVKIEGES